jgi:hypothetical protein
MAYAPSWLRRRRRGARFAAVTARIGVLYSYAGLTKGILAKAEQAEAMGVPVIWDSGAWSVHNGKATVNVDEHARWIVERQKAGSKARYIALDVIGNGAATRKNYKRQRSLGAVAEPTVHYGERPREAIEAFGENGSGWLNAGGVAGMASGTALDRARAFVAAVRLAAPTIQLHALGCTHPGIAGPIPLDAVDSTYWLSPTMHGILPMFDRRSGLWLKLYLGRSVDPRRRSKGWERMYGNAEWLRTEYGFGPDAVWEMTNEELTIASIRSHRTFGEWLSERHQRPVTIYLAAGGTLKLHLLEATL